MKTCTVEGCNKPVFGKHFCKYHYPKSVSPPKWRNFKVIGNRKAVELVEKEFDLYKERRDAFFHKIWFKRDHVSEVSGTKLGGVINSMFFHHILPKSKYPQAEFDAENIILLTPEEHANVELNIYLYEEINKRRIYLKLKYNII